MYQKQVQIKITVTEKELEKIKLVAERLGNKPATIAKQLLMESIRKFD